jgi:predicted TPR repeat methyltransferase
MATQPLFVSSGDLVADRRYRWAIDYLKQGDPAAAAEVLEQVVETAPAFATAWFALAVIREQMGDQAGAVAAFEAASGADPEDYHGARLHLSRLGARDTIPPMTATYVRRLFDQHAPEFDRSLLERLAYRGPAVLLEAVTAVRDAPRFRSALDLGCGTGLAGIAFRSHCDLLAGMDLSERMIEQARARGVYDTLAVGDVLEFLAAQPPGAHDLVLAADVFVYCGDLAPICRAAARVLDRGGLFAFTVERHDGAGVVLQPTLRYAHSEAHVRTALSEAGLELPHLAPVSTRKEKGEWVPGLVAVAIAPPTSAA